MSIRTYTSRLFSTHSGVKADPDVLHIWSPLLVRVLTLGLYRRDVWIDKRRENVRILTRFIVIPFRTEIPFRRIVDIETGFKELWTSWGRTGFFSMEYDAHDTMEKYEITLRLENPIENVLVYVSAGKGAAETGWKGVLLGDSLIDYQGKQEGAFHGVIDLVRQYVGRRGLMGGLGSEFSNPPCVACGKVSPPNYSNCMYCGGDFARAD